MGVTYKDVYALKKSDGIVNGFVAICLFNLKAIFFIILIVTYVSITVYFIYIDDAVNNRREKTKCFL